MLEVEPEEGFPAGSDSEESACSARDLGLSPRLGRSPGKGMGTHSSILDWRIPWIGEGGSPWGHKESDTTERLTLSLHFQSQEHSIIGLNVEDKEERAVRGLLGLGFGLRGDCCPL